MTRRALRAEYSRTTIRSAAYQDVICLAPAGLRVGYPSPRLLSALSSGRARQLRGRAIWITTANRHYAVDHVTVGTRMAVATHTLPGGSTVKVAKSTWYVVRKSRSTLLLKIHHGLVQELGIASNATTGTAHMRRLLASALG
jgi:predicted RecA/RadA family phage recombinase